jgi:trimethylguanosine synthase
MNDFMNIQSIQHLNNSMDCPYGQEYQKHWDLLSPKERMMKFDSYSLSAITPRVFSQPIIQRIQGERIVDACCSVGGMAIALAEAGKQVIAIELNPQRLRLARENAELFGVSARIEFIQGDVLKVLPSLTADTIFFDGQWMGDYKNELKNFSLADFAPHGVDFLKTAFQVTEAVVLRVPAQFDFSELIQFQRPFEQEATFVAGKPVAYTVYWSHV